MVSKLCLTVLVLFAADYVAAECEPIDPADDPKNIARPCPDFNMDCIREYFAHHSECRIAYDQVPDPLTVGHYTLQAPNSNMTGELYDVSIGGLNGKVEEFYINAVTDKLVLSISVDSLSIYSPMTKFQYNRKRKEPLSRSDFVEATYGAVTFTAVFPSTCNLDLNEAEVFSYVEDSNPRYTLGPRLTENLDATGKAAVNKFINSMSLNIQEKFVTQGKIFMFSIIEYNICDFGLRMKPTED